MDYKNCQKDIARRQYERTITVHDAEASRKRQPTETDYRRTLKLLRQCGLIDYCSVDDVPRFNTFYELQRWQKNTLVNG